jgi:hypothetical protein
MAKIRSAMGKIVDMGALARQNEETIAVSNVRMNARGDRLDEKGNIVVTKQTVARVQQAVAEPAQQMPMSQTDKISEAVAKSKPSRKPLKKSAENSVVSETVKTDSSGKTYKEIEYSDGSIETIDMGDDTDL